MCAKRASFTEEVMGMHSMLKMARNKSMLLMGDFNYPGIDWVNLEADSTSESFLALIQDNFWHQHVTSATREKNILDLVFTSAEGMVEDLTVNEHFSNSDHNLVSFQLLAETAVSSRQHDRYDFSRGNYTNINICLQKVNWEL